MVKETLNPSKGSNRAHLSPSSTCTLFRMRRKRFGALCSWIPADWMRNTKGPALPSMIGTSGALTSTRALSTPRPAKAESRCSTVATRTSPFARVVDRRVSPTNSQRAGISTASSRSVRRKTIPV